MAASLIPKAAEFLDANMNVLLIAKHGVGKTFSIMKECKSRGLRVKYYSCATLDPYTDLVGIPVTRKDEHGVERLVMVRPRDIDEAEVVVFDEANRADPKVIDAIFEITQFGTINGEPLPNLKCVWAAINPPGDVYKVEDLDPAWLDRFDGFIELKPKVSPVWMQENGLPKEIAMALSTWWSEHDQENRDGGNYISPRRVQKIGEVYLATNDPLVAIPEWIECERNKLRTLLERAKADMNKRLAMDSEVRTAASKGANAPTAQSVGDTEQEGAIAAVTAPAPPSSLGPNPSPAPTQQFGQGKTSQIVYDHAWIERHKHSVVRYLKDNPEDMETHTAVMEAIKGRHAPRLAAVFAEVLDALKPSVFEGFLGSMNTDRYMLLRESVQKLPPSRVERIPNLYQTLTV